jgi:hypothetical protein
MKPVPRMSFVTSKGDDGRWTAKCPLGLWEVSGPDSQRVIREATHYFMLYFEGGEYKQLIAPPPPTDSTPNEI